MVGKFLAVREVGSSMGKYERNGEVYWDVGGLGGGKGRCEKVCYGRCGKVCSGCGKSIGVGSGGVGRVGRYGEV